MFVIKKGSPYSQDFKKKNDMVITDTPAIHFFFNEFGQYIIKLYNIGYDEELSYF